MSRRRSRSTPHVMVKLGLGVRSPLDQLFGCRRADPTDSARWFVGVGFRVGQKPEAEPESRVRPNPGTRNLELKPLGGLPTEHTINNEFWRDGEGWYGPDGHKSCANGVIHLNSLQRQRGSGRTHPAPEGPLREGIYSRWSNPECPSRGARSAPWRSSWIELRRPAKRILLMTRFEGHLEIPREGDARSDGVAASWARHGIGAEHHGEHCPR